LHSGDLTFSLFASLRTCAAGAASKFISPK
jgi:hypothetical protein